MPLPQLLSSTLSPEQERLVWLAGSVVLFVVGTNVAWAFGRVQRWPAARGALAGLLRFAYFVGIPYASLLSGVTTWRSLGLVGAQPPESLAQGVAVAGGAVVLIGLIGWLYRRAVLSLDEDTPEPLAATREMVGRPWGWVLLLLTIAFQQIHWAFYRALPALILDDHYAGGFVGLALVILEACADPRLRRDLADRAGVEWPVLSAGFAVVTTVLFVLTRTSWLGAGTHFAAAVGWTLLVHWRALPRPHEP